MAFAVKSTVDVVMWFYDRALNDMEYIQPQKLQRLLYLSQAYYSVAYPGKKLMPATFVSDEMGPIEPTIYQVFSFGRPNTIEGRPLSQTVDHFLDSIWRRFGANTADQLTQKIAQHAPVIEAMTKGVGTEIPLERMVAFYGAEAAARKAGVPAGEQVLKPRVLRGSGGKAVAVTSWKPKPLGGKKAD